MPSVRGAMLLKDMPSARRVWRLGPGTVRGPLSDPFVFFRHFPRSCDHFFLPFFEILVK